MKVRILDMKDSPRAAHFAYFQAMANPYVGVTQEVEITALMEARRKAALPFFLSFLYCVGRAANSVAELRRRIVDGNVVEFETCDTSHTVMRADGTYSYCRLSCMEPFERFLPEAILRHEQAKTHACLEDGEDASSLLFISSLPWLRYTALQQPTPVPADSNPRITWGKYGMEGGRTSLPVTLLAHHALVDGVHIAAFYDALEAEMNRFAKERGEEWEKRDAGV